MISRARRLVVAVAALAATATVAVPVGSAGSAMAASPTHVGIVVRFADGNVSTACTTVGGNGYTVLSRKFQVNIGASGPYAGFLLQINQHPDPARPDTTHYWSYWHPKSGGGWTYSNTGAGSSTPKPGGVEGWSYVNGESSAPPPPTYTYAALCSSADGTSTPSRTATPTPSSSSKSAGRPTRSASHAARSTTVRPAATHASRAGATPTAATPATRAPSRTTAGPSATAGPRSAAGAATAATTANPGAPPTAATTAASTSVTRAESSQRASAGFPAWGTVVALLVVLALGGGAWLAAKRRPE